MLGKAKGQILRVAACLQVLFCDEKDADTIHLAQTIPTKIGHDALVAAQNFVDVCCQHAAYLAGRNSIEEVVKKYLDCKFKCISTYKASFMHTVCASLIQLMKTLPYQKVT